MKSADGTNAGRIPRFERKIAVMRSRGISASIILQSYSQGKALYKDDWETIVGNCDSTLFLGGSEKSTTEYVSKLIGKETIDLRSTSEQHGQYGGYSVSGQKTGRDLIAPDELARLDNEQCVYILRGLRPFLASKHASIADGQPYAYRPRSPARDAGMAGTAGNAAFAAFAGNTGEHQTRRPESTEERTTPDVPPANTGAVASGAASEVAAPPMLALDADNPTDAAEEWTILPGAEDAELAKAFAWHERYATDAIEDFEDAAPTLLAAE